MDKKLIEQADQKLYDFLYSNSEKSKRAWAKLMLDVKGLPKK